MPEFIWHNPLHAYENAALFFLSNDESFSKLVVNNVCFFLISSDEDVVIVNIVSITSREEKNKIRGINYHYLCMLGLGYAVFALLITVADFMLTKHLITVKKLLNVVSFVYQNQIFVPHF